MSTEPDESTECSEASDPAAGTPPPDETIEECTNRVNELIKRNRILLDQID